MPVEIRFIKFTLYEVIEALKMFSHKGKFELPKSSPRFIKEVIESESHFIEFTFNGSGAPVKIANSFVAASLIRYCRRFHIPIPKNEEKSIGVVTDGVILKIGLEFSKNKYASVEKKNGERW